MSMIQSRMTAKVLEGAMGWPVASVGPIHWLMIQEQAAGRKLSDIADGLGVIVNDLYELIGEVTGDKPETVGEGVSQSVIFKSEAWDNGITLMKAAGIMNAQAIEGGWNAIEAMAVSRLGQIMAENLDKIDSSKALEIAVQANKAIRRSSGEGSKGGMSVNLSTGRGAGEESDMTLELKGGHLGSMKLSLSQRVRSQLEQPRTIEQTVNPQQKQMLSLDDTRSLLNNVG